MKEKLIASMIAALLMSPALVFAEAGTQEHKGHAGMDKTHAACPHQAKEAKTEKKAVKDGIEIITTAEGPEAIAALQKKTAADYAAKDCPALKDGTEAKVENIENGVKVTVTAKKPAAVKKLHGSLKKGHSCCGEGEGKSTSGKTPKNSAKYICPMGDFEGSDKPGKCPKCGMNLVENK